MSLKIRNATHLDKVPVLKFCKNTFSWGDYLELVWDAWLSENHLFIAEKSLQPVGVCHASYSQDQIWIEGIRVHPNFRHQNIASMLITHAESLGRQKGTTTAHMLIEAENTVSLSMADSLNYSIFQTWKYHTLDSKANTHHRVTFESTLNPNHYPQYVKSWRWLALDDTSLKLLTKQKSIISSCQPDHNSVAIFDDSEHFEKTLLVTLFAGSDASVPDIMFFLQNLGAEKNYERIQILTKEILPKFDSLEHKLSFHLMKKSLL